MIIELSADGKDYSFRGTVAEERTTACWDVACCVLQGAEDRVTQREILENWLEDYAKPDQGTLSRTMKNAVADGRVRVRGTGLKNDPFQYWLPQREDDFHPGEGASREDLAKWNQRQIEKAFDAMARKVSERGAPRQPAVTTADDAQRKPHIQRAPRTAEPVPQPADVT